MIEWHKRLLDGAPEDMKPYIAAGLPLDLSSEQTEQGGMRLTATTRYPCALVGDTLYFKAEEDHR